MCMIGMISCEYRVCYPIYGLKIVEDIDKEICCHATCRRPHQPVINPVSRSNIKNHVVAVPCFRLQDRAVSRSFLFVVLVSDGELNGHLKHFVDSVVLFGRALDILCSH